MALLIDVGRLSELETDIEMGKDKEEDEENPRANVVECVFRRWGKIRVFGLS